MSISRDAWKRFGGALATSALTMALLTPQTSLAAMTRLTIVDREQFLMSVMEALQIAPDATGTSPYSDISTDSPAWGYIHKAVETGVVTPISPTYFGASALVTEQWAVSLAAAELHVSVDGHHSMQAFVRVARLFATYVPTALVLSTEVGNFEQRLVHDYTDKSSLTGTGTGTAPAALQLTPSQAKLFSLALQDGNLLSHEQTTGQQDLTTTFVLTPSGEQNALFRAEMAKQTKHYTIALTEREESIGKVQRLAITYVFPANFTRNHQALTEQIFATGTKTYVNAGAGWITNSQSGSGDSLAATGDAVLTLSNYDTMRAATVKGGTLFTGFLDLAKVPSLFASEVPLIGASLFDSQQLTALQKVSRVQMSILVSDVDGKPQVTALGKLFSVDIPASIIFANLNASTQSSLLKQIAALHYQDRTSSTLSFNDVEVPIPSGLPM